MISVIENDDALSIEEKEQKFQRSLAMGRTAVADGMGVKLHKLPRSIDDNEIETGRERRNHPGFLRKIGRAATAPLRWDKKMIKAIGVGLKKVETAATLAAWKTVGLFSGKSLAEKRQDYQTRQVRYAASNNDGLFMRGWKHFQRNREKYAFRTIATGLIGAAALRYGGVAMEGVDWMEHHHPQVNIDHNGIHFHENSPAPVPVEAPHGAPAPAHMPAAEAEAAVHGPAPEGAVIPAPNPEPAPAPVPAPVEIPAPAPPQVEAPVDVPAPTPKHKPIPVPVHVPNGEGVPHPAPGGGPNVAIVVGGATDGTSDYAANTLIDNGTINPNTTKVLRDNYPASMGPFVGNVSTADSVAQGVQAAKDYIAQNPGANVTLYGFSEGSFVTNGTAADLAKQGIHVHVVNSGDGNGATGILNNPLAQTFKPMIQGFGINDTPPVPGTVENLDGNDFWASTANSDLGKMMSNAMTIPQTHRIIGAGEVPVQTFNVNGVTYNVYGTPVPVPDAGTPVGGSGPVPALPNLGPPMPDSPPPPGPGLLPPVPDGPPPVGPDLPPPPPSDPVGDFLRSVNLMPPLPAPDAPVAP